MYISDAVIVPSWIPASTGYFYSTDNMRKIIYSSFGLLKIAGVDLQLKESASTQPPHVALFPMNDTSHSRVSENEAQLAQVMASQLGCVLCNLYCHPGLCQDISPPYPLRGLLPALGLTPPLGCGVMLLCSRPNMLK